jgi:hypothetical protein
LPVVLWGRDANGCFSLFCYRLIVYSGILVILFPDRWIWLLVHSTSAFGWLLGFPGSIWMTWSTSSTNL